MSLGEEISVDVAGGGGHQQQRVKKRGSGAGAASSTPPSSRLVVKNLPKSITEDKLRRHFDALRGGVTDVRLGRWEGGSGEFRGFGYVGFRSEEEARKAKEHFHRSFVGGGRVDVDFWVPRDLRDRAQSKRARREHKEVEVGGKRRKEQISNLKEKVPKLEEEILARAREDKEFAEFLGVNKVKQKNKSSTPWANDDDAVAVKAGAKEEQVTFDDDGSGSDDDSSSDDDVDEEKSASPKKKKKKEKEELFTLKLVDLPRSVRKSDVRKLFSTFPSLSSVRLPRNSRGFGFVGFKEEAEGRRAQKTKDKSVVKGGVVRVKVYKDVNPMKKEVTHKNKKGELEEVVESVGESGRIYVRNLGYDVTEEELRGVFQKYGPLVEVFIPVDGLSGRNKGYGFVGFMMPGDAERALVEVDGRGVLQGRVLHLLPAKEKPPLRDEEEGKMSSFKKGKLLGMKKGEAENGGKKMRGWNTLFVNMVAVSELMGRKYGVGREELLLARGSGAEDGGGRGHVESAGVRLALGEAEVVASVEKFLVEQGVCLAAFDGENNVKRSETVIVVRNLPVDVGEAELRGVFEKYGGVKRVVVPEFGVTALVEFGEKGEAKKAFRGVAYSKFRGSVVFCEWAPTGVFGGAAMKDGDREEDVRGVEKVETVKVETAPVVLELPRVGGDGGDLSEPEDLTTVFVKNLSWETSEERLKQVFGEVGVVSGVRLAVKKVGEKVLSQGYGFVQFWRRGDAVRAVGVLDGRMLDNHNIQVKESKKTLFVREVKKDGGDRVGTIISVKNVPFQATQEELADLFRVFGVLKGVRMPVKVLGEAGHRGFAFVEFLKEEHAKSAMDSLSRSCHLYGRRLVLSWAEKTGDNLELSAELEKRRKRAAASAASAATAATVGPSLKRGMARYFDKSNVQGDEDE